MCFSFWCSNIRSSWWFKAQWAFVFASGHGTMASDSTIVKNKHLPVRQQQFLNSCTSQVQTTQIVNNWRPNIIQSIWPKHYFSISPRLQAVPDGECTTSRQHHRISGKCSLYWRHSNVSMAKGWVVRNIWKYVLCGPPVWTPAAWNQGAFATPQHCILWERDPSHAERHAYLQCRTRPMIFEPQCPQDRAIQGPYMCCRWPAWTKCIVFEQTPKKKWWTIGSPAILQKTTHK